MTSAGFVIERRDWLGGYFSTVAYQLKGMATNLPVRPSHIGIGLPGYALAPFMALLKAGCAVSSIAFHALETRAKFEMRGYPKNYVAIVSKPAQTLVS